jgi:hypothetical protein
MSARIATFRCEAPARCGAFADERRIVAGDGGAECGREVLIRPVGQCGSADGRKSGALLVKVTGTNLCSHFHGTAFLGPNSVDRPHSTYRSREDRVLKHQRLRFRCRERNNCGRPCRYYSLVGVVAAAGCRAI